MRFGSGVSKSMATIHLWSRIHHSLGNQTGSAGFPSHQPPTYLVRERRVRREISRQGKFSENAATSPPRLPVLQNADTSNPLPLSSRVQRGVVERTGRSLAPARLAASPAPAPASLFPAGSAQPAVTTADRANPRAPLIPIPSPVAGEIERSKRANRVTAVNWQAARTCQPCARVTAGHLLHEPI